MIQSILKTLSAEWALHKHNKLNKQGIVDNDAQKFYIVPNALPDHDYHRAICDLDWLKHEWVRSNTPWRRGCAIGGHELREACSGEWLGYLQSQKFMARVREATGLESLQYVPVEDTNRLSLLLYEGKDGGDGIDWHVDGSIYLGQRWAGILVLIEDTREDFAKLELQPNLVTTTLPKSNMVNSLVLFQGDHVRHRVRPMLDGEERIVLSLLFSDWPQRTRNILLLRYQSRVNQAFYKNPSP